MRAVILAAGIGSRLMPLTEARAKCLIKVGGIPILGRQLAALRRTGITDVTVVAGHCAGDVIDYCASVSESCVKVISNVEFHQTNNMYSLYLARDILEGREFFLLNGDVVLDENIIAKVRDSTRIDVILAERGNYNKESMKIMVGDDGIISDISKDIDLHHAYGTSIDVYLFSSTSSKMLFTEISEIIEVAKDRTQWTEVALQNLIRKGHLILRPFEIGKAVWVEIDDLHDLADADVKFSSFDFSFSKYKAAFVDLDGTIYLGNTPIYGSKEFIAYLRQKSIQTYFLSNNSSRGKEYYQTKLENIGIPVSLNEIILSTDSLISYLERNGIDRVFPVGTSDFVAALESSGIRCLKHDVQAVVLGYDTELTYEKIKIAGLLLQKPDVAYLASHRDRVCPTENGLIPDIGSLIALFETATGRVPDVIFGKPDPAMIGDVLARDGIAPEQAFLIGDRVYTDGELSYHTGCDFVCVLSGDTDRTMLEAVEHTPKVIVHSVAELLPRNDNNRK